MKILNTEEIKIMSGCLCMTELEAEEVAEIFVKIYTEEQGNKEGWKIKSPLNNVDDYIDEWEGHWHRELNWEEFYKDEKDNYYNYYDEAEAEEIFKSLETFKTHKQNVVYELKHNGMIIVVC